MALKKKLPPKQARPQKTKEKKKPRTIVTKQSGKKTTPKVGDGRKTSTNQDINSI